MSSSFVKWVEGARIFARPRAVNATSCAGLGQDFSSCRSSAAGRCNIPESATLSGDACVCSTLDKYVAKFSECVLDTPYSTCIDPNNDQIMADWSSGHCTKTPNKSTPVSTPKDKSTPKDNSTPPPAPNSTPDPPPRSTPKPEPSSPKASGPPSTLKPAPSSKPEPSSNPSPAEQSEEPKSEEQTSEEPSKAPEKTFSSVPQPSFVPVTIAPRVSALTTGAVSSISSTHAPVPKWSGSGNLLQGYCATPEYTILDGPTAYWAPVIGCVGGKNDCCPFDVVPTSQGATATVTVPQTVTIQVPVSGATLQPTGGSGGFPVALSPAQATLDKCPDDYHSIGEGCCPSNYFPWSTAFGGQTPCYSTLPVAMTPPPIPDSLTGTPTDGGALQKPTSAIINVVYAMQYPVQPSSKPALTSNAKIGIGAGAGGAALIFGVLIWLLVWKHRVHKRDKAALESGSGFGPGLSSTRRSVNQMSRYSASNDGTGVEDWRRSVVNHPPPGAKTRFTEGSGPTLPNVGEPRNYPADWRPGQPTVSPPPAIYGRNPVGHGNRYPSPPIPEEYQELQAQQQGFTRYSGGSPVDRSELQSGEYFPPQELQGVPEGHEWGPGAYQETSHEQSWGQQPGRQRYYEAPAGRM
ncbi:hypothetical protein K469DRAFT_746771 [Zopfia rhizophila CBS 207.26]|uniref:Extracellular membrane protein CFEM domain-containing protein n=1 Tax=Zopfia rhizophila CBS 207.26 TaxID=1314779 RepID=A0A6A6EKY1_9PEZI|nr:hypothetical protein K469DRAFT_746771 [Zopfia rhizophila CBS 207.26]